MSISTLRIRNDSLGCAPDGRGVRPWTCDDAHPIRCVPEKVQDDLLMLHMTAWHKPKAALSSGRTILLLL
jgi:hypothetical protein